MSKQILFIQGAGQGAHEADKKLVVSLGYSLGTEYKIHYPAMPHEDDADYGAWKHRIEKELTEIQDPIIVVGHSVGGSILMKCISEIATKKKIPGIFLVAAPFWGGGGWRYDGYEKLVLARDFAAKLPKDARVFLYHGRDDETVPFEHLALYAKELPHATVRELEGAGHQLNNDLSAVAEDIIANYA